MNVTITAESTKKLPLQFTLKSELVITMVAALDGAVEVRPDKAF